MDVWTVRLVVVFLGVASLTALIIGDQTSTALFGGGLAAFLAGVGTGTDRSASLTVAPGGPLPSGTVLRVGGPSDVAVVAPSDSAGNGETSTSAPATPLA